MSTTSRSRSATTSSTSSTARRSSVRDRDDPGAVINCAAWTDVDGAESHRDEAIARERRRRRERRRGRGVVDVPVIYPSSDYVFDGSQARTATSSRTRPAPLSAYGAVEARRRAGDGGREPAPLHRARVVALRRERPELRRHDAAAWPTTRTRSWWCATRSAARPTRAISPKASCGCSTARTTGSTTWPAAAGAPGTSSRWRSSARPGSSAACFATSDMLDRPAPRPAFSVLGTSASIRCCCPTGSDGLRDYLAERAEVQA